MTNINFQSVSFIQRQAYKLKDILCIFPFIYIYTPSAHCRNNGHLSSNDNYMYFLSANGQYASSMMDT